MNKVSNAGGLKTYKTDYSNKFKILKKEYNCLLETVKIL